MFAVRPRTLYTIRPITCWKTKKKSTQCQWSNIPNNSHRFINRSREPALYNSPSSSCVYEIFHFAHCNRNLFFSLSLFFRSMFKLNNFPEINDLNGSSLIVMWYLFALIEWGERDEHKKNTHTIHNNTKKTSVYEVAKWMN